MAGHVAPLESGDRLGRAEFHRRYCAQPGSTRAELVQGVVYVPSPARAAFHGDQHAAMTGWLVAYAARHPEYRVTNSATVFLSEDDELQPDVCLFLPGGRARIDEHGYLQGAPDLVVEIAASSASYDLHDKMESYRRSGVPEYIVWRVLDGQIDWFRLASGVYRTIEPEEAGLVASTTIPKLRLDAPAMLRGDLARVLTLVERTA
jgi:Uma2 family endonuclease